VEAHRAYSKSDGSMKALIASLLGSDAFLYRVSRQPLRSQMGTPSEARLE